ncbi:MAG: dihydropteroate synthase [Bacteroidota bacterium]|jgi:dihydropteroate synthase
MQKIKLTANGKVLDLSTPKIMGIVNLTPDSFFAGSRIKNHANIAEKIEKMILNGTSIIDLGAVSTRPGSFAVDEDEELRRLLPALKLVRATFPEVFISVDTFRPLVVKAASELGADIINDVYAGRYDPEMLKVVSSVKLPYVVMHMKGEPSNMQVNPEYKNVVREVKSFFNDRIKHLKSSGIKQIILDPGFGFGKSLNHNYMLLKDLKSISRLGFPVLSGLSRKSMINKVLDIKATKALNGTTVLNTISLLNGASILRVHDALQASEVIRLFNFYKSV